MRNISVDLVYDRATKSEHVEVAYLHSHQIAHRDLKLENFLYERKVPRFGHFDGRNGCVGAV